MLINFYNKNIASYKGKFKKNIYIYKLIYINL
jgi:hypothetical protein